MRIVSLISSATEIICSLGLGDQLVGRSHECDHPAWVRNLPSCTEPNFDVHGSSAEIDQRVKDTLATSTSVYRVHGDVLHDLNPNLIVTQSQCEVCAVSLADVERVLGQLPGEKPVVVTLRPDSLHDVWDDIRRIAAAANVTERGAKLVDDLQERIANVAARRLSNSERPTVACIEWIEPLMAAGNWMPEIVERAGGINLFGVAGKHSPTMSWSDLAEKNPDFIFVMPCGFDLPRTRVEMSTMTTHPLWSNLSAVRANRVFICDGNAYFNRPGPRLVDAMEMLASALSGDDDWRDCDGMERYGSNP